MRNELRIIGGTWRSRKLKFPDAVGLRPTPDRVRETLFNWLRLDIEDARVLNLYAGSGALGFEAASRGAGQVVQVEMNPAVCAALEQNRALLQADQIGIVRADVIRYLEGSAEPYDLAFVDPPFRQGLLVPSCVLLEQRGWLKPQAKIYFEIEHGVSLDGLPPAWRLLRNGKAGEVTFFLYERHRSEA
ncbi:16S rRNA (guanine966-N2)-methyltransferase [Methylomagnum ishizawai]|uniref:Ribosomal RNA small subunit methyltransferase D n=1 Tax=Methylomagnum ishizawai TaxID=1760988 RepID=A0A1Y6CVA1_9GAMM|nr:16S rRNA (guanine(966)-N(2))-methyltransferase RsmD [Methylomagnum ishizawai]SMF94226.1 16S rRNA (guanine966-N2)-methyltransferase [Methylomagnum ishizawai]